MNYLVLGAGKQGSAVLHGLKKLDSSCKTTVTDTSDEALESVSADTKLKVEGVEIPEGDFDCVVSTLPFHLNVEAAKICRHREFRWVDLGGNFQSSEEIQEIYKDGPLCCTDMGLAPGLVGILACWHLDRPGDCTEVKMFCGGMSFTTPQNRLQYAPTFNVNGLVNEYTNDCCKMVDGVVEEVPCLNVDDFVTWENGSLYEAFITSGGVPPSFFSEMQAEGVKNASYRTIRRQGHVSEINHLINCGLTGEDLASAITACTSPGDSEALYDKVMIEIRYVYPGSKLSYKFCVSAGDGMTAMQRGTAYPVAAVAEMIADGSFDLSENLSSYDFATISFFDRLDKLELWDKGSHHYEGWMSKTETHRARA